MRRVVHCRRQVHPRALLDDCAHHRPCKERSYLRRPLLHLGVPAGVLPHFCQDYLCSSANCVYAVTANQDNKEGRDLKCSKQLVEYATHEPYKSRNISKSSSPTDPQTRWAPACGILKHKLRTDRGRLRGAGYDL